jgi:hypothetical protein
MFAVDPPKINRLGMASCDHPTRLRCGDRNRESAGEVVSRTQRQNAQGELVLDKAVNGRIERTIATAYDDEIQLRPVLLDACRNVFDVLDRSRDQLKIEIMKAFYRLRQGACASACPAIDKQQCALAHDIPLEMITVSWGIEGFLGVEVLYSPPLASMVRLRSS